MLKKEIKRFALRFRSDETLFKKLKSPFPLMFLEVLGTINFLFSKLKWFKRKLIYESYTNCWTSRGRS